jgi:hypothetical protein
MSLAYLQLKHPGVKDVRLYNWKAKTPVAAPAPVVVIETLIKR